MDAPSLTALAAAVLRVATPPERALVIECGDGEAALFLAREYPAARVRGVDRSPDRVRAATTRVGLDPEGRVAFKVGRPRALPYPDDFFDLVVQVDGRPAAAEVARVLRPQGHLVLAHTGDRRAAAGPGAWLLRRRLRRHGIEPTESAAAGDGSFSVARLRGAGRGTRAD
ncbi:MAG TPA: class I SAM-dependent methyltransferase [Solirubrobacterales bacterium]|nr:class I SAM-dependent methyltransferase [Solirubrobacterales bacterium]